MSSSTRLTRSHLAHEYNRIASRTTAASPIYTDSPTLTIHPGLPMITEVVAAIELLALIDEKVT